MTTDRRCYYLDDYRLQLLLRGWVHEEVARRQVLSLFRPTRVWLMMNTSVQITLSPSHVKATKRWAVMSSSDAGFVCHVNEHVACGLATSLYLFWIREPTFRHI